MNQVTCTSAQSGDIVNEVIKREHIACNTLKYKSYNKGKAEKVEKGFMPSCQFIGAFEAVKYSRDNLRFALKICKVCKKGRDSGCHIRKVHVSVKIVQKYDLDGRVIDGGKTEKALQRISIEEEQLTQLIRESMERVAALRDLASRISNGEMDV